MKKTALVLVLLGLAVPCFADDSKIEIEGKVISSTDSTTLIDSGLMTKFFTSGVAQVNTVSLTASTNTAITVPSGAKAVLIDIGSARRLHLVGIAGDRGISLDNVVPVLLPLSVDGSTTLRLSNDNSTAVNVRVWFF